MSVNCVPHRVQGLQDAVADPHPLRDVLRFERLPVDPAGHHHQHLGEVLQRFDVRCLVDLAALHGHLHTLNISGVLASTD